MVTRTGRGDWRRALAGEREIGLGWLLFAVFGAPVAWSAHFLLIYFLVTLYCNVRWTGAGLAIGIATVVLGAVSVASGVVAYRARRRESERVGWSEALVRADARRTSFLLMMGIINAVLFTLLIAAESLPPLFLDICPEVLQ